MQLLCTIVRYIESWSAITAIHDHGRLLGSYTRDKYRDDLKFGNIQLEVYVFEISIGWRPYMA
jgi:hypothetical protein